MFSSNYPLYEDLRERVMAVLEQFVPDIEVYSIDEAFLEFKGFENENLQLYGEKIRDRILKWTGILTSVGIAPTKALAKGANKIARKFPEKTNNTFIISNDAQRVKVLKWTKIESVWGIGRQLSKRLKFQNIHSACDFSKLSDAWVLKNFSITELNLKKDLEGKPTLQLEDTHHLKKSIATTRSF